MRIAVLIVTVATAAVCWFAASIVFWRNFHYLTEATYDERISGFVDRLNSNLSHNPEDGGQNLGYFLVNDRIENRIILPEEWDGEFGAIEFPPEVVDVPTDFLEFVHWASCNTSEQVERYVENEVTLMTVFFQSNGRLAAQIRADSTSC